MPLFLSARLPAAPPTSAVPRRRHRRGTNVVKRRPPLPTHHSDASSPPALQCPHFETCSGCSHELALDRPPVLAEVTDFFRGVGVSDFTFDSGRLWEWRCRAKLAVQGSSSNPTIGLYQQGTHTVVDIPSCRAHHPSINSVVGLLKQGMIALDIQPYDEDSGQGELRYVQMAVTAYNTSLPAAERYLKGKVQLTLVWNANNEFSPGAQKLKLLSRFIWRNGGPDSDLHLIHSVWANFQTSQSNVIFGNQWSHMLGEQEFWEHVGGVDISLAPSSFGQANTQAFDSLLRKLQKHIPYGASVVDIYAGAGVIGLSLAFTRKCKSVKCVEINKESKISFEKSIGRLPKTVNGNISWHHADASDDPLHWFKESDVIIVDPPRKGLHPSLIAALHNIGSDDKNSSRKASSLKLKDEKRPWVLHAREAAVHMGGNPKLETSQMWPETFIYISCGWESFKEDCKSLLASKMWHLKNAYGFNFFPGADSIEILAIFKRGPQKIEKKKKSG